MDVATIRKFLHLLDLRKEDFAQELELQNIKGEITKKIRLIQGLEKDLDAMDIKIGLLVKNRIDVEEVVAHGKHLNRRIRDRTKSKDLFKILFKGYNRLDFKTFDLKLDYISTLLGLCNEHQPKRRHEMKVSHLSYLLNKLHFWKNKTTLLYQF